jgi:hypothetical protein
MREVFPLTDAQWGQFSTALRSAQFSPIAPSPKHEQRYNTDTTTVSVPLATPSGPATGKPTAYTNDLLNPALIDPDDAMVPMYPDSITIRSCWGWVDDEKNEWWLCKERTTATHDTPIPPNEQPVKIWLFVESNNSLFKINLIERIFKTA